MINYFKDAPISVYRNNRDKRLEEIYTLYLERALKEIPDLRKKSIDSKEFRGWVKDLSRWCNELGRTYTAEFSKLHKVFYPLPFTIDGLLDGGGTPETFKEGLDESEVFIESAIGYIRKQGITKQDIRDASKRMGKKRH